MKLFMSLLLLAKTLAIDPHLYMCLVVYTENREEILIRITSNI